MAKRSEDEGSTGCDGDGCSHRLIVRGEWKL